MSDPPEIQEIMSNPLEIQHPGFGDKIISDAHIEKQHPGSSRDILEKQILAINEQGIYKLIYIMIFYGFIIYDTMYLFNYIHVIDELTLKGYRRRVSAVKLQLLDLESEEGISNIFCNNMCVVLKTDLDSATLKFCFNID